MRSRWFVAPALSLVLVLGGGCVTDSTPPAPDAGHAPPVLGPVDRRGPMYGVVWRAETDENHLTRLDPRTLRPVAGAARLNIRELAPWTISPDRSLAVFGRVDHDALEPDGSSVHLVDLARMRQTAVIKATAHVGVPNAALWLDARRVLLLGDRENYDSVERGNMTGLVSRPILVATIVDLAARRVVAHRAYTRNTRIAAVEPSRRGLVVLSAPAGKIGTAELGLVDTRGRLRVAPLGQVTAGFQRPAHGGEAGSRQNVPGLAVDAAHDRAYVVAAGSPVAEVALADLRVTYHRLAGAGRRPSVLAQLRRGLVPAAEAKVQSGPERHARWLGAGRLAVSGTNSDFRGEHDSPTGERRPSGLQIIDTRDWSVRTIDNDAGQVVLAANRLVTVGATTRLTDGDSTTKGAGLRIRAPGSRRPVQLYAGRPIQWIQAYGPYVYADLANNTAGQYQQTGYAVIDARTGKLVGEHQDRLIPVFLD